MMEPVAGTRSHDLAVLIERVADRDESALGLVYEDTSATVYGLAHRILGDREQAQECVTDVFHQVWKRSRTYDPDRGGPEAWLIALTRSRALDRLRSERARHRALRIGETPEPRSGLPGPMQSSVLAEWSQSARDALQRLPPEQREAIQVAYFQGLSQSEVAQALNQPLGTIKTRMRNGMRRLRELLGSRGMEPAP